MVFHLSFGGLAEFAEQFWDYVKDARVFAFQGPMGAGKTTIIETLAKYKGVRDMMGSPTFSIINEYLYWENGKKTIYHIDLYRLKDEQEVIQTGVEDCMYSGQICFIEWPEKAIHLFDENAVHVAIVPVDEHTRNVKISLPPFSMKEQS